VCAVLMLFNGTAALAQSAPDTVGGEAGLKLPDLSQISFLGMDGHKLLTIGILFCILDSFSVCHLQPAEESAGTPLDARGFRTHL